MQLLSDEQRRPCMSQAVRVKLSAPLPASSTASATHPTSSTVDHLASEASGEEEDVNALTDLVKNVAI